MSEPKTAKAINEPQTGQVEIYQPGGAVARPVMPTAIQILEGAIKGGITADSVGVVERLTVLVREEKAAQDKAEFNRAFFKLKRDLPVMYADKEVQTKSGAQAFMYLSPAEIKDTLEPLLQKHGFAIMADQVLKDAQATVTLKLIHESGHEERNSFTVRVSPGNSLMSPTQCDAAASTAAERHALIKMFGIRSRIQSDSDPKLVGETITKDQADQLAHRLHMVNGNVQNFLRIAGCEKFADIKTGAYDVLDRFLTEKEQKGK